MKTGGGGGEGHPHTERADMDQRFQGTVKAKVGCEAVKIHGPNSPFVLSGEVPLGYQEPIAVSEPEKVAEFTFDELAAMIGQEAAEEVFNRQNGDGDG